MKGRNKALETSPLHLFISIANDITMTFGTPRILPLEFYQKTCNKFFFILMMQKQFSWLLISTFPFSFSSFAFSYRPLVVHCGDKFTIVTCSTRSGEERNAKFTRIDSEKKEEFLKSKKPLKKFTEFSHKQKMDKILEKIKLKNDVTKNENENLKSGEDSQHDIDHEDVGNVLLSLLGRILEFQIENLDPCHTDNSDSCDVHTYMDSTCRTCGPDRFILGPKNPVAQLGLTLPYGLECTPVTMGKLLLLIEKYSSVFCDDLTLSAGLEAEEKEKAVKHSGNDGKKRNWEEKTMTPGTVRGQNNRNLSDSLSTTFAIETHARGMRRAASLLHESNLNKDRNDTKSPYLPKYFSTPSTPPSHTITLSALAQREYSKGKTAQKINFGDLTDEKKNSSKILFSTYGALMDTLKILRYNLSVLARQVLLAEMNVSRRKSDQMKIKSSVNSDHLLKNTNEHQNLNKILHQNNTQIGNLITLNTGNDIVTGNTNFQWTLFISSISHQYYFHFHRIFDMICRYCYGWECWNAGSGYAM